MAYGDQAVAPIPEPLPSGQQSDIKMPGDSWTDDRALRIVRSDFAYAESYRTHAHDWRYRNADELYLAWAGQRYWDGTRVPRSSIGIYVVYTQVESMLPQIVGALTNFEDYNFSDLHPDDMSEACLIAWREHIETRLNEAKWREQIRRALKAKAIYGNGVIEVGYEDYEEEEVSFTGSVGVRRVTVMHPTAGKLELPMPSTPKFGRIVKTKRRSRPYVRYVSIKDFYVDPNCESTCLQDAGYTIKRTYMRAEEVKKLRNSTKFKIPNDEVLANLSKAKATANQDVTKQSAELFRYNLWNPAQDYSSDPSQKRVEVIEYTSADRKIWLLGRDHVIYNQPNRYGQINYFSTTYADVPDRWHGMAVSDVAEGEQRLQQAIINARIDELALSIHRPMIKRRGVTIPAYQLKVRPGVVIETEAPEGDIRQLEVQNITQQAYIEVQASDQRVNAITGIDDATAIGAPSAGGDSSLRTATGVNTRIAATSGRMNYQIENDEDTFIGPALNFFVKCEKKFGDLDEAAEWLRTDPRFSKLDPVRVMNTAVYIDCRAAMKKSARMGFLQLLPILMQYLLNPELLQMLAQQQHKTIHIEEFTSMVLDAISYSGRNPLIVPMTQQQIQQMQQPPADAMIKGQLQAQQQQSNERIAQFKEHASIMRAALKEGLAAYVKSGELDDKHAQSMIDNIMSLMQSNLQQQNDNQSQTIQ